MKWVLLLVVIVFSACSGDQPTVKAVGTDTVWVGRDDDQIKQEDSLIKYGHALISNTSYYLGPKGKVASITNGMNCQNCHLDGGRIPFSNNYGAVASTYPKFRDRSGGIENIQKRINDCIERSLNGKALDTNSIEMKAILAYMHWLGDEVPKGVKPKGSGIMDLPYLDRAADSSKGRLVFTKTCIVCHGANGAGVKNPDGYGYTYPPIWGENSYNTGAGLFRISRFAGYVKNSMPFGQVDYKHTLLSDEEAWDVAAFVNSMPRPGMDLSKDWPNISKKPVDHPFGPYTDGFSEKQHKYGPFEPIKEKAKSMATK